MCLLSLLSLIVLVFLSRGHLIYLQAGLVGLLTYLHLAGLVGLLTYLDLADLAGHLLNLYLLCTAGHLTYQDLDFLVSLAVLV